MPMFSQTLPKIGVCVENCVFWPIKWRVFKYFFPSRAPVGGPLRGTRSLRSLASRIAGWWLLLVFLVFLVVAAVVVDRGGGDGVVGGAAAWCW